MCRSLFTTVAQMLAKHIWFAFFVLFLLFGRLPTCGQTNSNTDGKTPVGLAPGAPAGSYGLSNLEQINLFSGRLSMNLPILSLQGRGKAGMTVAVNPIKTGWRVKHFTTYNPPGYGIGESWFHTYQPEPNWWNDSTIVSFRPGGMLIGRQTGANPYDPNACGVSDPPPSSNMAYGLTHTKIVFSAPDGTEYELRDTLRNGAPLQHTCQFDDGHSRGTTFVTADGSAATFISDTNINDHSPAYNGLGSPEILFGPTGDLILRDGTRYRFVQGKVQWIRDANGNRMTFSYAPGGTNPSEITDSLNRKVTFEYKVQDVAPYGLCDRITYKGSSGQTRVLRISYQSLANTLRADQQLKTYSQLFPELDGYGTFNAPDMVSAVWLPDSNNRAYKFKYNSYSELARVELPTGGAFEYDYSGGENNGTASGVVGEYTLARNPYQYAPKIGIYRRVTERRVYSNSSNTSLESVTNYGKVGWSAVNVSVDQYGSAQNKLAATKHFFLKDPITQVAYGGYALGFSDWDEGKEFKTEAFTTAGGLLRRTEQTWQDAPLPAGPRVVETVTTLADITPNLVSKQTHLNPNNPSQVGYDQYNNPTDTWEYDYGSGATGSLVRRSHTDYVTSPTYTGTAVHLRGLPLAQQVFDAAGNKRAETLYEYDDYSTTTNHAALVNRTNISGLDAAFTTSYTTRGNVTKVSQWRNTDNAYLAAYSQYDIAGNAVKAINANGNAMTLEFNDRFGAPNGEAQSNTNPSELSAAGQSSFAFPTKVTNALNHITYAQVDYYTGKPVDTEDPNNIKSSLYYDDVLDRPTKGIRGVGTSLVNQTLITYDDANRTISTATDKDTNSDGVLQSKAFYDGLGRTYRTAANEGATWAIKETQFDALGRAYRSSNPFRNASPTAALPGNPEWTTSTFDALGRVTQITTPDGAHVDTSYSGNTVTVTDQAGKNRKSETDALGRLKSVWENPTGLNYQTSYSYDTLNNLTTVTQGAQTRSFAYDSLKRLTSATNPESGAVNYTYDNNGNLIYKVDALSRATWYPYDALNRSQGFYTNQANTPQVVHVFDTATNGKGQLGYNFTTNYWVGGSTNTMKSLNVVTGYDALGRVQGQHQYHKNAADTDWGNVYTTSRTYDLASHVKSQTYPSGRVVNYSYNTAEQLTNFSGNLGDGTTRTYVSSATYNPAGLKEREGYGMTTPLYLKAHYNKRQQMVDLRLGSVNDEWNWNRGALITYYGTNAVNSWNPFADDTDNNGNVRRAINYVPVDDAISNSVIPQLADYTYDNLNRIGSYNETQNNGSSWAYNVAGQTFGYDRYGNRQITATLGGVNNYNPSYTASDNRIVGMTYDAVGNITNDGTRTMAYDANNKLVSATIGSNTSTYQYNANSSRISKTVSGVTTWYIYGLGGELVAEYPAYGAASTPQTEYGYRDGALLIEGGCETVQWRMTDHLGSTRMSVGVAGSLASVKRTDYLPFGETLNAGIRTNAGNGQYGYVADCWRQKFTGYERDVETGLDYAQARMFAGTQGRFTSPDEFQGGPRELFTLGNGSETKQALPYAEIANPQSLNKYQYAYNNPLRYIDPDGHMPDGDDDIVTKVINSVNEVFGSLVGRLQRVVNGGNPNPEVDHSQPLGGKEKFIGDYMQEVGKRADLATKVVLAIDVTGAGTTVHGYLTGNKTEMGMGIAGTLLGPFGRAGTASAREAVNLIKQAGTHEAITIGKKAIVPTRQVAEKLIAMAGGTIRRVERAHTGVGHPYPHINYSTATGENATIRVQSVGKQFFRKLRKTF